MKKAEKIGLRVDSQVEIDDCLGLFRATRTSPQKWGPLLNSYDQALAYVGTRRLFGIRDSEGQLLAATYIIWDRFRSYYLLGGYQEEGPSAETARIATTVAIWEAMRFTREDLGLRTLDLEGSMIPGVELFFRKFGGVLTPFYTIAWNPNASSGRSVLRRAVRYAARLAGWNRGTKQHDG